MHEFHPGKYGSPTEEWCVDFKALLNSATSRISKRFGILGKYSPALIFI